jgi:ADP-ribosylglycohydrolase
MRPSRDQIIGCLVGGAIGDVLGGFRERSQLCLSDDTQLTLATCEAIRTAGRVSPEAIADALLRWFRLGQVSGMGASTLKALIDLSAGAHWALSGARGEMAAGNGAAMRIAPLAFLLDPLNDGDRVVIRDVCRITHHHDEAYAGALAVALAIQVAFRTQRPPELAELAKTLPDCRVRDRLMQMASVAPTTSLDELVQRFGSSGYVVETVPLALLLSARLTPQSFELQITHLSQVADDADTIGAIAGQVAGARLGYENLAALAAALASAQRVLKAAGEFAESLSSEV